MDDFFPDPVNEIKKGQFVRTDLMYCQVHFVIL
jgi:hypothetical protein